VAVVVGKPEKKRTVNNPMEIPVFAWKDETLEEYWWCTLNALSFPDNKKPN